MSDVSHNSEPANNHRGSNWSFDRILELALIAVLALVGVGQLCVYRQQAAIMDTQSKILRKQTDVSEAAQRAFVVVDGMKVVSRQGDDKEFWDFVPEVKNSGMTSTKNLNYSNVGIHCMKLPNGKDIIFPEGEDPARIFYAPGVQDSGAYTRAIIGPQSKLRDDSMIGTISKNNFATLQQAFGCSDRIAASGVFIYRDTLPDTARHITKYCYISEPGADFLALCDHWNCADDECKTDAESYNKGVERAFRDAGKPVDPQFLAKPDFP